MAENAKFKILPLTLSIETSGGIVVPLVHRGTPLPAKRQQKFTTVEDNQKVISFNICLGESPIASKNILLTKVELKEIPDSPRGEVSIDVMMEVNAECRIKVTAKENKTSKAISLDVEETATHLTVKKIQQMLLKANETRREDKILAELIEAKNKANSLAHRVEKYLQDHQKYGLNNSTDNEIEESLAKLGLALQDDNLDEIREKTERLETLLPKDVGYGTVGDLFSSDMFSSFFGSAHQPTQSRIQSPGARLQKSQTDGSVKKELSQSEAIAELKKGLFASGQNFDAKSLVRDIFSRAEHNIVIIDAYVGEDVLNLLTVKCTGVQVRLLTGKVSPSFLTLSHDFNRQYSGLEVRSSKEFHDRFVIVDDKDFYHFGASLEHLGNKAFMYSKLEEPAMIESLRKYLSNTWSQADQIL